MAKQTQATARATLLDRLVDLRPDVSREATPLRTLDKYALRISVRDELDRLLNTRSSYPAEDLAGVERTVVHYGIADFSHLSPQNPDDQSAICREMERTVEAFEPRLQNVHVVLDEYQPEKKALTARINAVIVVENIRDPVSFPFVIQLKDRGMSLNAS